jgi:hypothetical protein
VFSPFSTEKKGPKLQVKTQPTSGVSSFETSNTLDAAGTPLFVSKDTYGEDGITQLPTPLF